ncbi:MAG: hypothetical protein R2912_03400 [Eubacteriales bacterium]
MDDLSERHTRTVSHDDLPLRISTALAQDNADERLTHKALRTGLITGERYERLMQKRDRIETAMATLDKTVPPSEALRQLLTDRGESVPVSGEAL